MSQEITVVTESLIPSEKMLDAIIHHFGFRTTVVEMAVYAYMRHLCPEYDGGMWNYYELSNGAFTWLQKEKDFIILSVPTATKTP